jgi:hypothetical protein
MPLRARVGRHANTGAHCQNWIDDQLEVIMLLNLIPASDGGAQGGLTHDHVVAGIASDALYKAILRFQKQHFPAQQSGFIDPAGPVLARMEMLAERAPPAAAAPRPSEQWGEFKSGSVQRALHKALTDGSQLTHERVVDVLWSTLSNGTVSTSELDDLEMVADKSRTIAPRSKALLTLFVKEARDKRRALGPYQLATQRHIDVAGFVCDFFLKHSGRGQWLTLDRDEVGVGILMRLAYPGLVDQNQASLCGPAAFLFSELQDHPGYYASFAIDMYEKGTARLGGLSITPNASVRRYSPPSWKIAPVDWLTMASLRDSENWFVTYDTADKEFAGATTPFELVWWFNKAGYSDVKDDVNLVRHQRDTDNMDEASRLFSAGYRVCLLIDYEMLQTSTQADSGSALAEDRHWVVLRSRIDRSGGNVKMTIFTWGEANREVPKSGVLPLDDFLMNYYGYVAGKP